MFVVLWLNCPGKWSESPETVIEWETLECSIVCTGRYRFCSLTWNFLGGARKSCILEPFTFSWLNYQAHNPLFQATWSLGKYSPSNWCSFGEAKPQLYTLFLGVDMAWRLTSLSPLTACIHIVAISVTCPPPRPYARHLILAMLLEEVVEGIPSIPGSIWKSVFLASWHIFCISSLEVQSWNLNII